MLGEQKQKRQKDSKKQTNTNKGRKFRICLSQNNIVADCSDKLRLAQYGRHDWCRTVGLFPGSVAHL